MVSPARAQKFRREALQAVANAAAFHVRPKIPSKTLRQDLEVQVDETGAALYLDYYWALYVHDGRGAIRPQRSKFLVWFKDPTDDPRTRFGARYPRRAVQVRRLTKREFQEGLRRNRQRAPGNPYMIVARQAGPIAGTPFFEQMSDFMPRASRIFQHHWSRLVAETLADLEDPASVDLRL